MRMEFLEPKDKARFERLRQLTPIQAIDAWLNCEFGFGDEQAMLYAIRKDLRITCSNDEIVDIICDAMDELLQPEECLRRLIDAK